MELSRFYHGSRQSKKDSKGRIVSPKLPTSRLLARVKVRDQVSHPLRRDLPLVFQSTGQTCRKFQTLIRSAQQNRSAVGTPLSLIKFRDYGTRRDSREQNTLCYRMLIQTKASCWSQNRLDTGFVP